MPNRIIKETIRTNKAINSLSDFQFRLWTYLLTYVDDYGRGSAEPEILKGFLFPRRKGVTEATIEKGLTDLANIGLINLYNVGGESYLCFSTWSEHQRIQQKRSKFPDPAEGTMVSTVGHGDSPWVTVGHGESPSESNPIQSNPIQKESESKSESNARARAKNGFDAFWSEYPKKVGKESAKKAFAKVSEPVETLLYALKRQKCSIQWTKDGGQYIPNPSTWLNQRRWEDDVQSLNMGGAKNNGIVISNSGKNITKLPSLTDGCWDDV